MTKKQPERGTRPSQSPVSIKKPRIIIRRTRTSTGFWSLRQYSRNRRRGNCRHGRYRNRGDSRTASPRENGSGARGSLPPTGENLHEGTLLLEERPRRRGHAGTVDRGRGPRGAGRGTSSHFHGKIGDRLPRGTRSLHEARDRRLDDRKEEPPPCGS